MSLLNSNSSIVSGGVMVTSDQTKGDEVSYDYKGINGINGLNNNGGKEIIDVEWF